MEIKFKKEIDIDVVSLDELWKELPQEARNSPYGNINENLYYRLGAAYGREMGMMMEYAASCEKPRITFRTWRKAGTQYIAEFAVSEMATPSQEKYNFHGQNISQWRYAGGLVYQDGQISLHH